MIEWIIYNDDLETDNSWELFENLACKDLINQYENNEFIEETTEESFDEFKSIDKLKEEKPVIQEVVDVCLKLKVNDEKDMFDLMEDIHNEVIKINKVGPIVTFQNHSDSKHVHEGTQSQFTLEISNKVESIEEVAIVLLPECSPDSIEEGDESWGVLTAEMGGKLCTANLGEYVDLFKNICDKEIYTLDDELEDFWEKKTGEPLPELSADLWDDKISVMTKENSLSLLSTTLSDSTEGIKEDVLIKILPNCLMFSANESVTVRQGSHSKLATQRSTKKTLKIFLKP